MNYLLAEIKKRGKSEKTFKIFSVDDNVYPLPTDLDHPKAYNSDYKLEDDEWFHIPNFTNSDYCIDLLKQEFNSAEFNQITKSQLENIKYLIAHQIHDENGYFFFQKINTSQLVKKSWFKISDTPTLEKEAPIVIVNDYADAIFSVEDDILYFKKLTSISSIFKGISELYREATQEETEAFLEEDFVKLEEDFKADNVGTANRKRIALATDTLGRFSDNEKVEIFDYIKDYCNDIPYDDEARTFTVKDEDGLKHLLWGIEQRYYTTKVGAEKRVANSVSKVE
jgi:hypothetical protein